jgi:hypothetical protein
MDQAEVLRAVFLHRYRRVAADYELQQLIGRRDALQAVRTARVMVGDFQATLTAISAVPIVDGARRHLKAIDHLGPTP